MNMINKQDTGDCICVVWGVQHPLAGSDYNIYGI